MFEKVSRKQGFIRLGLVGASGSGKTHSALLLAAGLGGKPGVIDTELGSASLEVGKPGIPEFVGAGIRPPYTVDKYLAAIKQAAAEGVNPLIIDSLTHAWAGEGGILDEKDRLSDTDKFNSFTAWRLVTPKHNKLVDAMLTYPGHLIATMRAKAAYVLEDKGGRMVPRKVGMAPIQREGMDYEFTLVFDLSVDGNLAMASKDRTSLFMNQAPVRLATEHGQQIHGWLFSDEAEPLPEPEEEPQGNRVVPYNPVRNKPDSAKQARMDIAEALAELHETTNEKVIFSALTNVAVESGLPAPDSWDNLSRAELWTIWQKFYRVKD